MSQDTTDQEFRDYFAQFGRVVDATLMMDKDTGRPRGFGFVTFESETGVDNCINVPLEIHGKPIEVKKAQPRGNLREEEEAATLRWCSRSIYRRDPASCRRCMRRFPKLALERTALIVLIAMKHRELKERLVVCV